VSAAQKAAIEPRPYDCKIQSISDIADGRAFATLIRRDNTSVRVGLAVADLEYWAARIAAILAKANE
jgi:hypothetical protein